MNNPAERNVNRAEDSIQDRLTRYACALNYDRLPSEAIHAAKVRIIDTLGVLIGAFPCEPGQLARNLAAQMPNPEGATIIGTRMKTTPDVAAFVNATTARYVELTDSYHGSIAICHVSDTVTPVLSAAEHAHLGGRELITGIVLAYEVGIRISDVFHNHNSFDHTNFVCLATAVSAGKMLGLSPDELAHCISMAVVPNVILRQARLGNASMFKAMVSGLAGRAGVFAAMMARAGMQGPHLPFEGKAGWCEHVARERFSLNAMGGNGVSFKISETLIKNRPACGFAIAAVLAAEKVAPFKNTKQIKRITVETHKGSVENTATGAHRWNPDSREVADHSIPYCVAATLMDGTVTLRSYNDIHLSNPELHALMQKIEVVENQEFTKAYNQPHQQEHRARVIIVTESGERLVGEAGGDQDDLSAPKSDAQIEEKFRSLSEDVLGAKQVNVILDRLWNLEDVKDVSAIPAAFVLA